MLLNRLKPKSEFSRNVLTLMTGTTIAQSISIAISPILTRLYTPDDFGTFALYMSIVSIVSVIATGQYELAIMLPKKENDSKQILYLSILLSFIISGLVFLIILFFNVKITNFLNNGEISEWLYLLPFSVLTIGLFNSFNYWFNRNKQYNFMSTARVSQSFLNSGSNLTFGFLKLTNIGLIVSSFISQLFVVIICLKKFRFHFNDINYKKIILLAKRYKKFPKITMPHSIFSTLSQSLPILILAKYFTNADVGYFSFGNKIVLMPLGLISGAYYHVFFQSFKNEIDKLKFYSSKFKQVNLIFLPLFSILWFVLPELFSIVFGEDWKIAGEYSQIILPLLYMKFLSNLFTTTTYIYYQKQEENFVLSVLITCLIFVSLIIGTYLKDIKIGLFLMMITNSLVIIFKLHRSFQFVKENDARNK